MCQGKNLECETKYFFSVFWRVLSKRRLCWSWTVVAWSMVRVLRSVKMSARRTGERTLRTEISTLHPTLLLLLPPVASNTSTLEHLDSLLLWRILNIVNSSHLPQATLLQYCDESLEFYTQLHFLQLLNFCKFFNLDLVSPTVQILLCTQEKWWMILNLDGSGSSRTFFACFETWF